MSDQPIDPELQRQLHLDAICIQFENALRNDQNPQIETFLEQVTESDRDDLLVLLLLVDLEYSLGQGQSPEIHSYLQRYADSKAAVRRAFEQHAQAFATAANLSAAHAIEAPGTMIGRYKLLEQIGEGGMGVVYMAEQQEPVRRKVALKIIKPGMDTKQVIARFEAERQALAMMEHANIARVLDAGSTAGGRPFFVMELVRGIAITNYCDEYKLSTHERLELFKLICKAVQHAHTKGIIHRDLKPGNVLVTLHDGVPVPKIIDFGIAKATGHQLTEKTVFTSFSQMVGTPLYMSPEQAEMTGLDIDTRSDIYSLGVLLYELLTGTTPFDRRRLQKAAYDEVRRIIREEEPDRPSTRFNTSDDSSITASQRRAASPAKLQQMLRGELDWIVMKALDKDRKRRYETASLFATEVERYLNGEPVEACPPTLSYRFQKFVRRNKTTVALGLLFFGFFCLTAWKWWDELKARQHAVSVGRELLEEKKLAQSLLEKSETNLYYSQIAQADLQNQLHNNPGKVVVNLELAKPKKGAEDRRGWEWGYLNRQLNNDLMTIHAGTEKLHWINDIAFSADGRFFATAVGAAEYASKNEPEPGLVRIFNAASGKQIFTIAAPDLWSVYAIALSSDGHTLATLDRDWFYKEREKNTSWQVRLWDVRTQTPLRRCSVACRCESMRFSPDGTLLAADCETAVRVWKVETGEPLHDFPGVGFRFSDDSRTIVVSGDGRNRKVTEFNTKSGELIRVKDISAQGQPDPTDQYLVSQTPRERLDSHTIFVNSATTGELVHELRPESTVWDFDFHPGGNMLAAAGSDGSVRLWDLGTGNPKSVFAGHTNHVSAVAFSPRGDRLVSGDWNGIVKVWDITRDPEHLVVFQAKPGMAAIENMAFEPGGQRIVGTWQYFNSHVYMIAYDVNQGHSLGSRGDRLDVVNQMNSPGQLTAFNHPATRMIGVTQNDQTKVKVWNVADGSELNTLTGHSNPVRHVCISNDGNRAVAGAPAQRPGDMGHVVFWDIDSSNQEFKLQAIDFRPSAVAQSRDGSVVVIAGSAMHRLVPDNHRNDESDVGSDSREISPILEVWDVEEKQRLFELTPGSVTTATTLSPDDSRIAFSQRDGTISLLDVSSGGQLFTTQLPDAGHHHLAFSPDGKRLACTTRSHTTIWDAATGHEVITLRERGKFRDYAFNPRVTFSGDGKLLATSQWDATAWIRSAREITPDSRAARVSGNVFRSQRMNRERFNVPARLKGWWSAARESLDVEILSNPKNSQNYARRAAIEKHLGNFEAERTNYLQGLATFESESKSLWITGQGNHVAAPHIPFDEFESFTIEMWVKKWVGYLFYQGYGYQGKDLQGQSECSVWLLHEAGRMRASVDQGQRDFSLKKTQAIVSKTHPSEEWEHVAVVHDKGKLSLFIGGKLVAGPQQIEKPGPFDPSRPFWIGFQPVPKYRGNGLIRNFRITESALYDSEFEPDEHFEPGTETVLLFDFAKQDFSKETVVNDLSGNGNDGEIRTRGK